MLKISLYNLSISVGIEEVKYAINISNFSTLCSDFCTQYRSGPSPIIVAAQFYYLPIRFCLGEF